MLPGTESQHSNPANPRGLLWMGLAAAVVAGFCAYWLTFGWRLGAMQRANIDRGSDLMLKPGEYTIYNETRSIVDHSRISGGVDNDDELRLFDSHGNAVNLSRAGRAGYDFGDYAGQAMLKCVIQAEGRYFVRRRERLGMFMTTASPAYAFDGAPAGPAESALGAGFGVFAAVVAATALGRVAMRRRAEQRLASELAQDS